MKNMLAGLALWFVTANASAAGWSGPLTVEYGFVENSDLIVIYTSGGGTHVPGCTPHAWVFRADSDARRARGWATILAALTTGQRIQLWYNDNCGTWSYHEAASIMLLKPGS
jgi:hypothetical protein